MPTPPTQRVDRAVTGQTIVEGITGTIDGRCAGEGQVFDVGAQGDSDAGLDQIGAFVERLGHNIQGIIDDIGIVSRAADQGIGASVTTQGIGRAVANQYVIECIAGSVDGCCAGEGQILDIAGQGVGDAGLNRVGADAGRFNDQVTYADHVGIVAGTTGQRCWRRCCQPVRC